MVARAERRGSRRGRNALGGICAAGKCRLIIVDEEQENSFKQEETPRYHGRDVAIVRAKMEGALALLGSATPSMETYHHARNGKYELLMLASRVADRSLASVEVVDLREDFQQTHQTSPISAALHAGIQECLANGTQALVLINRRGYSWSVLCRSCGASVQWRELQHLDDPSQTTQPAGMPLLRFDPANTEAVSEVPVEICLFFWRRLRAPRRKASQRISRRAIARLDRDTARTKRQYQKHWVRSLAVRWTFSLARKCWRRDTTFSE